MPACDDLTHPSHRLPRKQPQQRRRRPPSTQRAPGLARLHRCTLHLPSPPRGPAQAWHGVWWGGQAWAYWPTRSGHMGRVPCPAAGCFIGGSLLAGGLGPKSAWKGCDSSSLLRKLVTCDPPRRPTGGGGGMQVPGGLPTAALGHPVPCRQQLHPRREQPPAAGQAWAWAWALVTGTGIRRHCASAAHRHRAHERRRRPVRAPSALDNPLCLVWSATPTHHGAAARVRGGLVVATPRWCAVKVISSFHFEHA